MKAVLFVFAFCLMTIEVHAQTFCTQYSNGSYYCDGPSRSTIISPTGPNNGVIMDSQGNFDTYSIQRNRRAEEDRREEERRRERIYGEDRRDSDYGRSRYDDSYGSDYGR